MKGLHSPSGRRTVGRESGRFFLFVGGPFGPFFRKVSRILKDQGADVLHVHMHGADWLDWGFADAVTYRGRPEDWREWLISLLDRNPVTDVVTYGDCGRYSQVLLDEADKRGLIRHVYELGYVRPHYITLDRNGVNGIRACLATRWPTAWRRSRR
jgi:capsular polysaccharide export protein